MRNRLALLHTAGSDLEMMMKKAIFLVLCLAASLAWAQDSDETGLDMTEEVDLRVSVIENIDVTAEKAPVESFEEEDAEIDAILNEADALEDEEVSEEL